MAKKKKTAGTTKKRAKRRTTKRRGAGVRRPVRGPWSSPQVRFWLPRVALLLLLVGAAYVVYLDFSVRRQMEGKRWALPATVYSQPVELYAGKPLSIDRLERHLESVGYRKAENVDQPGTYTSRAGRLTVYTREFHYEESRSAARRLEIRFSGRRVDAVTADGAGVAIARIEPRRIGTVSPGRREDRTLIKLDDVPMHLVGALLAVEDKNYTEHFGIDPRGLARAMWENIKAGAIVQGGSTITQQLVKNFYLTPERSIVRKVNEAIMAVLLELHYDKREILQTYLNEVYLGQSGNSAVHGFGLASQYYFNRPVSELAVHQSALLVALVRGASYYNPRRHPERARARRNLVVDQMQELGFLDEARAKIARAAPLDVVERGPATATVYPAFMGLLRRQIQDEYRDEDLNTEGLRVFTTLDPEVQSIVESATRSRLASIEDRRGIESDSLQAAVVVARVESGEVVAVLGGRRARFSGFNRAVDAERPVGSIIKPGVYLAALEASADFTLATVIQDTPITVEQRGAPDWSPENYDKQYHGPTLLVDALAHSFNVATARVGLAVGIDQVTDMIRRLGVEKPIPSYPSVLLGAVELAPVEVARLYLTIANTGFRTSLRTTRSILSGDNEPLSRYAIDVKQVVEPDTVRLLHFALQEVLRTGTARAIKDRFEAGLGLAGKTGTTDGFRDSWFAGYSGNYVTVVWIGRDDNQSTGLSGASGAMLLWGDIMAELDLTPTYPVNGGRTRFVKIDEAGRYARGCINGRQLPFVEGTVPVRRAPCATVSQP